MASLKEIKERIASVRSTRKITSAMKMVAAAKLHRAQRDMGSLVPYAEELQTIVAHLAAGEGVGRIPLALEREVRHITIVGFASNTTFCGAYNINVGRSIESLLEEEYAHLGGDHRRVVALGRQLVAELERVGVECECGDEHLAERPNYAAYREMLGGLIDDFLAGRTDRVVLVYYKFISPGVQRLVCEQLLPIVPLSGGEVAEDVEYILEPSKEALIEAIVLREVALKLFAAALSAVASEHVQRMMAMQAATDNADDLIASLSLEYNKQRQQAITAELLDMMGGQRSE